MSPEKWQHSPLCSGNGIAPNPGCSCGLVPWLYREAERTAVGAVLPPQTGNPPPDLAPIVRDLMSALWTQTRLICTEEDHPRSMRCQSCASRESINRAEAALRGVSSLRAPQSGPWTISYSPAGQESDYVGTRVWPDSWTVVGGKSSFGAGGAYANHLVFHNEREAIAVRDALNAVAGSGAETPPQPETKK